MQQHRHVQFRSIWIGILGLILIMLFTACAGVTTGSNTGGSGNTPTTGSSPTATPSSGGTGTTAPPSSGGGVVGSIEFIGPVKTASATSITATMPNGQDLTLSINTQTDLTKFNGTVPTTGTIHVKAAADVNGNFTATELKPTDSGDLQKQNIVTYQGTTTSTVGSDNMLHFKVGTQSYSFAIGTGAELKDFNGSAANILVNQMVKVEVTFNGTTGTVTKVSNASGS